ncbi:MAG: hypothetical protein J6E46_01775, partial [Faecalicoccus sp.]|nr:hypothetical protein [Faecalicoccus sp.]
IFPKKGNEKKEIMRLNNYRGNSLNQNFGFYTVIYKYRNFMSRPSKQVFFYYKEVEHGLLLVQR